jgi:hypothetical protein
MEFTILDSSGSAVASFGDDLGARAAIHAMVAIEPEAADHVLLLTYGDDGVPVGEARTVWDVPAPVTFDESAFVISCMSAPQLRTGSRSVTRYVTGMLPAGWQPRIRDAQAV